MKAPSPESQPLEPTGDSVIVGGFDLHFSDMAQW